VNLAGELGEVVRHSVAAAVTVPADRSVTELTHLNSNDMKTVS